jgi:hypothetical protein
MAKKKKEPIPPETVDRMLVKCGRRCCICRRRRAAHLQVHHIIEQSEGGTHDEDNLIVTCQSCHTDIHSIIPFMRRFTVEELKGHRNAVVEMVKEGKFPANDTDDMDTILALIARTLPANNQPAPELLPEAKQMLVSACEMEGTARGKIVSTFDTEGHNYQCGVKQIRLPHRDRREQARFSKAVEQLLECKLIEDDGLTAMTGGNPVKGGWKLPATTSSLRGSYQVRYEGYLAADEFASAAKDEATSDEG